MSLFTVRAGHENPLHLSSWLIVGFLWVISSVMATAQVDDAKLCSHVRLTGSTTVRGYVFKNYEGLNPDDDSACVRIYRDGKVVYRLTKEDEKYYLGQPGDSRYKIPHIANGADLTGDGRPDMIVTSWSGGAHCCFTHYVFELEPEFQLLATIDDGDTDLAHFEKLDSDRGYYYVSTDIWSYWPSSFASSVSHKVLLRWDGQAFHLDLDKMRYPPPTLQKWQMALKDVDDALMNGGEVLGNLGITLWDTVLDLIYTGHSDLAWKFVKEANPNALRGDNPSLEEFCVRLKGRPYWSDLEPALRNMPEECARAKDKPRNSE
jgi:hypothetical protein